MGGKTQTQNQNQFQIQNQTTQSAPWAIAQPGLERSLGLANQAADTTYNGPSVAALDPLITQGQNSNIQAAIGNTPGLIANSAGQFYQGLIPGGGVSSLGLEGVGNLNQAAKYLDPYASGSYVQSGNPYLDAVLAKNDAATIARINGQFSSAGRYGSGAYGATAGGAIQAADNQARMAQYNTDVQNQLSAIQGLGNIGQAKAGIGQQGVGNINSFVSQLPTIAQGQLFQGNTLQSVGGQNMDFNQRVINAANQDPWTKAQNLAQITGGIGQLGGTSSSQGVSYGQGTTTKKEDPGIFGDILAGVGAGANLLGAISPASFASFGQKASDFFSPPTFQGVYGSPFGGIGSDIRIKDNIKELAALSNGLKLYSFTYKSGGPTQVGFIAQEVEKLYPEAVQADVDGIKYVDYGMVASRLADARNN
jgi:hypothetical protein